MAKRKKVRVSEERVSEGEEEEQQEMEHEDQNPSSSSVEKTLYEVHSDVSKFGFFV